MDGQWHDAYKDPVTDSGKGSKRGRLTLMRNPATNAYCSVRTGSTLPPGFIDALTTVYENGEILIEYGFDEIRALSNQAVVDSISPCLAANG
jgi:nicotinamide phosphoribosyltransferase